MKTKNIGKQAEDFALTFLKQQGLKLVKRNYFTKLGEIDLIMLDTDVLVFIEVRYRKSENFLAGFETVDRRKQAHILKAAKYFIVQNSKYASFMSRFDIISLHADLKYPKMSIWQRLRLKKSPKPAQLDWIQNAMGYD